MSERKVLNKYYPPDFDPSKIPRMKLPKNRQYTVRLMAPFNMRCATCGEYIYRGKKFNARKEDVEGEDYCGIRIYRFYIKCTRCLQEISFKTDPKNTDYVIEAGAIRNFMALKLAEETEKKLEEEIKEEEANNPMTLLENRTQQSKMELELMESLEELKDLNRRHYNTDFNSLLAKYNTTEVKEKLLELQQEKDEQLVQSILGKRKVIEEEVVEEIEDVEELSSGFSTGSTSSNLLGKNKQVTSKFGSSSSSFGNSFGKSKPGTSKFANFSNFGSSLKKSIPSKLGSSSSSASTFLASSKSETPKPANNSDEKSSALG